MRPKKIARVISENIDEHYDDPALDPVHFANAVNAVIAAAPHGQQQEAIKKLISIGQADRGKLIDALESIETKFGNEDMKYIQDFYRSKASNINLLAQLASTAYDNPEAVNAVLDSIDLATEYSGDGEDEDEDEDLYNSEGDGYSH